MTKDRDAGQRFFVLGREDYRLGRCLWQAGFSLAQLKESARRFEQARRSGFEVSDFEGGTLYTSTEPCAMCCGAIYWAGIRRVVYACSHESLNKLFVDMFPESTEGGGLLMSSRQIFAHGGARTEVYGPYLEQEAIAIHKKHWPKLLGVPAPTAWRSNG